MSDRPAYLPTSLQQWLSPTSAADSSEPERRERTLPPPRPFYTPDKPLPQDMIPTHAVITLDPSALNATATAATMASHLGIASIAAGRRIIDGCGVLWETPQESQAASLHQVLSEAGVQTAVVTLPDIGALRRPFAFNRAHIQRDELILAHDENERRVPLSEIQAIVYGHVQGMVNEEPAPQCHIVSLQSDLLAIGWTSEYTDRRFLNMGEFVKKLATAHEGIRSVLDIVAPSQKAFDQNRRWATLGSQVR